MEIFIIVILVALAVILRALWMRQKDPARMAARLATMTAQERLEVYQRMMRTSPELREKAFAVSPGLRELFEEISAQQPQSSGEPPIT